MTSDEAWVPPVYREWRRPTFSKRCITCGLTGPVQLMLAHFEAVPRHDGSGGYEYRLAGWECPTCGRERDKAA